MPSVCLSENSFGFILFALVLTILHIPVSVNKDRRPLEAVVFLVALVVLGTPGGLSALAVHDGLPAEIKYIHWSCTTSSVSCVRGSV